MRLMPCSIQQCCKQFSQLVRYLQHKSYSSFTGLKTILPLKLNNQDIHRIRCRPIPLHSVPIYIKRFFSYKPTNLEDGSAPVQLAKDLYKNILYSDVDIIAFNKFAGISVYGTTGGISVIDVLPELCRKFQKPHLELGLSLKSFYSGLVLLCKSPKSKEKLDSVLKNAAAQKVQFMSYLVISVGTPACPLGTDLLAYISRDFLHDREMSIVQEKSNNTARKSGSMMLASFKVQTLAANDDLGVALVEISTNKDKWEAVEAVMSHHLSPVLGDNIYSSRTQYVMGVPFRASAYVTPPALQRLPRQLKEALEVYQPTWRDNPGSLPLHMHRHKITLNRFPKKESPPLVLTAPPPQHFTSLLKHLDLYTDSIGVS